MLRADEIIVISDLHLAPERGTGLFQADQELAGFLRWLARPAARRIHVVVAGDLLDYLVPETQGERVEIFNPENAPRRARSIIDHHPEVFDALSEVAQSPDHRLLILGGNHDPEIILPDVQQVIEERLATAASQRPPQWLVNGEAARFSLGAARISIEHGDLFDDWNRIDRDKLRRALGRITRGFPREHGFQAPPGSQLVVDFVNELRPRFPWVDYLKPEREAVIPILNQFLPLHRRIDLRRALEPWLRYQGNAFETLGLKMLSPVALIRGPAPATTRRQKLAGWLELQRQLALRHLREQKRRQLIERLREASAEDGYFDLEHLDETADECACLLDQGTDLLIQGHTHAAKAYKLGERGLYINAGTWVQLLALPACEASDGDWEVFLANLDACRQEDILRPTFVHVYVDSIDNATRASLAEWCGMKPVTLARFLFDDDSHTWTREV
jgi:UDP-2,3-diacylglucosamine pyrophosphatase LpxH